VLTEPHPLPCAEVEFTIRNRHCQVGTKETRFYVGRHIIRSLAAVSKGHVLGDYPIKHHLHVVSDVRVPVLVDGETGGGVKELDVHQTNREL